LTAAKQLYENGEISLTEKERLKDKILAGSPDADALLSQAAASTSGGGGALGEGGGGGGGGARAPPKGRKPPPGGVGSRGRARLVGSGAHAEAKVGRASAEAKGAARPHLKPVHTEGSGHLDEDWDEHNDDDDDDAPASLEVDQLRVSVAALQASIAEQQSEPKVFSPESQHRIWQAKAGAVEVDRDFLDDWDDESGSD